jgi:hypothetical protein
VIPDRGHVADIAASSTARLDPRPSRGAHFVTRMIRRFVMPLLALYATAAVIGHLRERTGAITCGCSEDCWCKRPGLSALRWVFPFRHELRMP